MSVPETELDRLLERAPEFDSVAHAVYWLRWHERSRAFSLTIYREREIGYQRLTEHVEIHLAAIYMLAEELYRRQHCEGV